MMENSNIMDKFIERWRSVIFVLLLILIGGGYSYSNIAKESDPDIPIPIIYISVAHEGISPEDSEKLLIRPLEKELSSIDGVKEIKSKSYQGGGNIMLEFLAGFDSEEAMNDVREAVDKAKSELPDGTDEPMVKEVNISLFPILIVTFSGDVPERTLIKLSKNMRDRIETIPSVLEARIAGDREELVEIILEPEMLEAYKLKGVEILNFFNLSNRLVAAGNVDTGEGRFAIEVPGLFDNVQEILEMPLVVRGDSVIKVKDIASIKRTYKDRETYARSDGKKAIALEIVKKPGENVIETIEQVKAVVTKNSRTWPDNLSVTFSQDRSEDIRTMLNDLQNNIISAVLLVMTVMIVFLGFRAAALVGLAIPGAFLSGILIIYLMGLTINIVVLFSLILSVGMLVDGAIVVTEYADRKMSEGMDRRSAYSMAAKRMFLPITISTVTTLAAFAPLLFWPDIVGEFMKFMPITLLAVLSSSLLMALIFVPVAGAILGKKERNITTNIDMTKIEKEEGLTALYISLLRKVLNIPGTIILVAVALLIIVQVSYVKFGKGIEFFPDIEPKNAVILVHARGNLSIDEKDNLVREVEEKIENIEGIKNFYTRVGKLDSGSNAAEDVIGQIQIEFKEWNKRRKADEILNEIKDKTKDIAGIYVYAQKEKKGPQSDKDIEIQISSYYPELLPIVAKEIINLMEQEGNFIDIEDSLPLPKIKWEIKVDRAQAAKFGLDITTIGYYVRMVTNGLKVGDFRAHDSDDEIDIVIRHGDKNRTLEQLDKIRIETEYGSVPITNFVKIIAAPAVGTINRSGQKRIVTIKANVKPEVNINEQINKINNWISNNTNKIDKRVQISFKGDNEKQKRSADFLKKAFAVALFIMAIILVTQFNSIYHAFLVLSSVIMSTIGVMLGLLITGQPFGIVMSGVGVIALAGIIVNNNIVLIDTYHYLMKTQKLSRMEVIIKTGAQRLRPVLLTTITTILGLMPMVLQINIDFIGAEISVGAPSTQWWVQLSTAIAFGLAFSTMLTLIVTPCALMFPEKIRDFLIDISNHNMK